MTRSVIDMKVVLLVLALPLFGGTAMGQVPTVPDLPAVSPAKDPGVRGGSPGAGGPIHGLNTNERAFFSAGQDEFEEVQSVQGEAIIPGTEPGLGPRFNLDSCAGCHAQPATGGTSPRPNPQVEVATKAGASNDVPFFVTSDGPVREARFKSKPNGARDGGVHGLFTIRGRQDASGCDIFQPDFAAEAAANNLIFRIPTPVFGAGLIEAVPDATIVENKNSHCCGSGRWGSPAARIGAVMTAPSPGSAGRRRTSPSSSSRGRRTTSSRASPMNCSRLSATKPLGACSMQRPRITPSSTRRRPRRSSATS